jgi:type IV secretion system protein VirB1
MAQQCAPEVHHQTMAAVAHVESGFNPFAIGVVGGRLERQPANKAEAVATAQALEAAGMNFSVGVSQVNRYNLPKYGLSYEAAFDACRNLRVGALILKDCFDRAKPRFGDDQRALQAAFSCYYSGNFSTGFKQDFPGQPSYVQKVLNVATQGGAPAAVAIPLARAQTRTAPTKLARNPARRSPETVVLQADPATEPERSSVMVFR